jgi:hypothetical protein
MTEPPHAVIARLSADFAAISHQLARVSSGLTELDRLLAAAAARPAPYVPPVMPYAPPPAPYWPQQYAYVPRPTPPPPPMTTPAPPRPRSERSEGWIGKVLAVAGVAVTLIGVVLLLVLAAQAGILRPEIRVGAGTLLAGALVAAAWWLYARPGGRVGAIALAATGIAAAYMDVIAVSTIYDWVPAPAGLAVATVIGGGGLTLARRWNSQHLGLLVLVPLIGLAPVVTDGITLLLVGFMLAISAASLPVQLGKDWIWLHAARIAAPAFPLLAALAADYLDSRRDLWLAGAGGIAAVLAIVSALILLPRTGNRVAMALLTAAGVVPVLCVSLAVDRVVAALMAAALSAALLAIVLTSLPGVTGVVRRVWSALGFAIAGGGLYLSYAPPSSLVQATPMDAAAGISTLVSSLLLVAWAVAIAWSWKGEANVWAGSAAVVVYAVTTFAVTAGVLVGGTGGGFFAGHMAATICWIAMAAALFVYAARLARSERSLPIGAGLALVAAAMAKLFLFDLGTLDGIFRVVVFIVVGLVVLGMGAGYARILERQDQQQDQSA